jgi:HK97 family phage major capsid protein
VANNSHANDAMIRRLEGELNERSSAIQGVVGAAQADERDLNEAELKLVGSMRTRIGEIKVQLDELESTAEIAGQVSNRMRQLDVAISTARRVGDDPVEYRSAGQYICDQWSAHLGDRNAQQRLEVYNRVAAHQKTSDNTGIIPIPAIGDVINFIDAARPMVTKVGPRDMPSQNWFRPLVTQQPTVGLQGSAGAAADEKAELVSQKMTITKLAGTAVTYGGYVNVSRQDVDFSNPGIMDIVIEGLANAYALQTETALGTALDASAATNVGYAASPTAVTIAGAIWSAAGTIYNAVKGAPGRLVLAVAADRLAVFGPLFPPFNVQNGQSAGLLAGNFGSGEVGNVAGVQLIMSPGLASTKSFLFHTSAVDVFERRVGSLQAVEPSVLGIQVAYAGYFTPVLIPAGGVTSNGVIELTAT